MGNLRAQGKGRKSRRGSGESKAALQRQGEHIVHLVHQCAVQKAQKIKGFPLFPKAEQITKRAVSKGREGTAVRQGQRQPETEWMAQALLISWSWTEGSLITFLALKDQKASLPK